MAAWLKPGSLDGGLKCQCRKNEKNNKGKNKLGQ
jgi:hypothetical protein